MIPRDRGRGRGQYPHRGEGQGNFPPLPYHSKSGSNTASSSSSSTKQNYPLYGEFMEFIKAKKGETSNTGSSYASIVITEEPDDSKDYYRNPHQQLILILEEKDIMRKKQAKKDPLQQIADQLKNHHSDNESMTSVDSENQFHMLSGESQPIDEELPTIPIENLFTEMEATLFKDCQSKNKDKMP
ncbi:hypothetical protein L1887_28731 [Cichorium endivia]|nr:hypothetical protein L1887_28731 [Cichorium endivia]